MKYQHIDTKEVKDYQEIKDLNKHISYPKNGTDMLGDKWKLITPSPQPAYDQLTQGVREIEPINYVQTWEVYELDAAEKEKKSKKAADLSINEGWKRYKFDKEEAEKQAWIDAGMPDYTI